MPGKPEKIDDAESQRLAKLRNEGPIKLDACLNQQIKEMPIIDQVATLSNTGRLMLYYEAVGKARLEGYSWKVISDAATGKKEYKDGQDLHRNYKSFCKNNGLEPVKIRKSK